jgi:hypothetical protein
VKKKRKKKLWHPVKPLWGRGDLTESGALLKVGVLRDSDKISDSKLRIC